MNFLSLFAGIGGIDLGLERAGWKCVGQVEIDPYCNKVLEKHWPEVWRHHDIQTCSADDVWRGASPASIDAIVGGFPCQDLSLAGKGEGLVGRRSGLFWELVRLVSELRPRWLVLENVPALRCRGGDEVLAALEEHSYQCWSFVVGARHAGAPHQRDRVFIVGNLADPGVPAVRVEPEWIARGWGRIRTTFGGYALPGEPGEAVGLGNTNSPRRERLRSSSQLVEQGKSGEKEPGNDPLRHGRAWYNPPWPARPREPQHDWEAPRVSDFGVDPAVARLPRKLARQRRAALTAVGNAVSPPVAEMVGHAVIELDKLIQWQRAQAQGQ